MFDSKTGQDMDLYSSTADRSIFAAVVDQKKNPSVKIPEVFYPSSIQEVLHRIEGKSPDFEGYVLSFCDGASRNDIVRLKVKSSRYLTIVKARQEADNDQSIALGSMTDSKSLETLKSFMKDDATRDKMDQMFTIYHQLLSDAVEFYKTHIEVARPQYHKVVSREPRNLHGLYYILKDKFPSGLLDKTKLVEFISGNIDLKKKLSLIVTERFDRFDGVK